MAPTSQLKGPEATDSALPSDARLDNLGQQYSRAADDSLQSDKKREAAMLLSIAEGHLDDGAAAEVLSTIADAISLFREVGDSEGLADSLRLQMHGYAAKAKAEADEGLGGKEEKTLFDAEALMREELSYFRAEGNKRGEAAMLVAVAEALTDLRGSSHLTEALDYVMDAQDIARELGDMKLEGDCAKWKCDILCSRHRYKQAMLAAKEAIKLFNKVGDTKNEAFAWKAMGSAQISNGRLEDGLVSSRKAMTMFRRLGNRKMEAVMLLSFAGWYTEERSEFAMAIKASEEAEAIFKEIDNHAKATEARIQSIKTWTRIREFSKAEELALEGIEVATGAGHKKDVFNLKKELSEVYKAAGQQDIDDKSQEALRIAQELAPLAKETKDKRFEARALMQVAEVYYTFEEFHEAEPFVHEAVKIYQEDCKRVEDELFPTLQFLGRICVQNDKYEKASNAMFLARKCAQNHDSIYYEAFAMLGTSGAHYGKWDQTDITRVHLEEAKKAAQLAQEYFQEEGHHAGEARVYELALSEYALEEKDFEKAVKWIKDGIRIAEDAQDNSTTCRMKNRLAEILFQSEDYEEAAKVSMQALKLARLEEDKRQIATALSNVLNTNYTILNSGEQDVESKAFRQQTEKLARYAKEMLGLTVKINDQGLEAVAESWVARMNLMQGKFAEAIRGAEASMQLFRAVKEIHQELDMLVLLADALHASGETELAVQRLNECVTQCQEAGHEQGMADALKVLEEITDKEGGRKRVQEVGISTLVKPAPPLSKGRLVVPEPNRVRWIIGDKLRELSGTSDAIDTDAPIMESGIDSLTSVELRTQLQQEFRVSLPSTVMHSHPTISALAQLVIDEIQTKGVEWRS